MRRTLAGTVLLLVVSSSVLAGCASRRLYEPNEVRGGTQLVASDESRAGGGPELAPQPTVPSEDPLLLVMSRMVANDGAVRPLAWKGIGGIGSVGCPGSSPVLRGSRLLDADLRTASAPFVLRGDWWYIGPPLPMGLLWLTFVPTPCDGGRATSALAPRIGLMAPGIAGRDTSVLFTTKRANVSEAPGSGIVEAILEQFVAPRSPDGESRKAVPRIRPRG